MLDTKRILQLGIGVAVGMVAYHFISKAMNRGGTTVGATGKLGIQRASGCRWINCRDIHDDGSSTEKRVYCCEPESSLSCCDRVMDWNK